MTRRVSGTWLSLIFAAGLVGCGPDGDQTGVADVADLSEAKGDSVVVGDVLKTNEQELNNGQFCVIDMSASNPADDSKPSIKCFKSEAEAFPHGLQDAAVSGVPSKASAQTATASQAAATRLYVLAVIYEHWKYNTENRGQAAAIVHSDPDFCRKGGVRDFRELGWWNDKISSIQTFGGCLFKMYWDWHFESPFSHPPRNSATVRSMGNWNDNISSFKVHGRGWYY